MTLSQPHPKRCVDDAFGKVRTEWRSQCRFFWWDSKSSDCEIGCTCSGEIEKVSIWDMRQIEKRGCASHSSTPAPALDEKCYIITETGMNLAIAVLKSNHLYDTAESVLKEIRQAPPAAQNVQERQKEK